MATCLLWNEHAMANGTTHTNLSQLGWLLHAGGLALTGMLLAAVTGLAVLPLAARGTRLAGQIQAHREFLSTAAVIRAENDDLTRRRTDAESRMTELLSRLPDAPHETDFLAQLTQLASGTGILLRDYRPGPARAGEHYSELEIGVSAQGGYSSLCRFLSELEAMPRLCRFTHLDVNTSQGDSGQYPVTMTLKIYFAPVLEPGA